MRSAIVRGKTARVRIQRNLVDVGLEVADIRVASCDGKCDVKNVRKRWRTGQGLVELEIVAHNDAPLGSATLVLPYFGGGRGEYPLTIVRNSRIANVTSAVTGERTTRVSFTGTELNAPAPPHRQRGRRWRKLQYCQWQRQRTCLRLHDAYAPVCVPTSS